MPLSRIIPATQTRDLPIRPLVWRALACEARRLDQCCRDKPTYAEYLKCGNAAARRCDDATIFSSKPVPLAVALREINAEDRRADYHALARDDAPAFAPSAPVAPRPQAQPTRHEPAPAMSICSSPASPIVPPMHPTASPPLAAAYRLTLPLARGLVIDLLA